MYFIGCNILNFIKSVKRCIGFCLLAASRKTQKHTISTDLQLWISVYSLSASIIWLIHAAFISLSIWFTILFDWVGHLREKERRDGRWGHQDTQSRENKRKQERHGLRYPDLPKTGLSGEPLLILYAPWDHWGLMMMMILLSVISYLCQHCFLLVY